MNPLSLPTAMIAVHIKRVRQVWGAPRGRQRPAARLHQEPVYSELQMVVELRVVLPSILSQKITIHCTVTGQMMKRPGYLREFLEYWTPKTEIRKVWFSLFTPQVGDRLPEMLQPHERLQAIADMLALREEFPKLDMPEGMIRQLVTPPRSPKDCVFALTTQTLSADLKTEIVPCQFGGNPDCGSCGCVASMGLAA